MEKSWDYMKKKKKIPGQPPVILHPFVSPPAIIRLQPWITNGQVSFLHKFLTYRNNEKQYIILVCYNPQSFGDDMLGGNR